MKWKEILLANTLIIVSAIVFATFTFNTFSNQSISELLRSAIEGQIGNRAISPIYTTSCSSKDPLQLDPENDTSLAKLVDYQNNCESFVTDRLMIFIDFPYDLQSAQTKALVISQRLEKFHRNKITPIVIVEPYIGDSHMEYRNFINGDYDDALDQYFFRLKSLGITDQMMGVWVPFPESNTPNWANKDTEPADFALAVNKYLSTLKKYFPEAQGSILLNATTYEPDDLGWDNGDYINLNPYLVHLDKSLIDSFGIQGFPWRASATRSVPDIFRASEFIQPDIAISAAQELRTKDIWINSGSFYSKYTNNDKDRVLVSLNERKGILNGILEVARYIKEYQLNEYRVRINLFAEDKSEYEEATDWSYFQNEDTFNLLKEFLKSTEEAEIPVSLFDR